MPTISTSGTLEIPSPKMSGSVTLIIQTNNQKTIDKLLVGEPYVEDWAFDISKNTLTTGDVVNEKAINVSIENILSTLRGERLFSPYFGSDLQLQLFETMTTFSAETLLSNLLSAISLWEDRITIVQSQIEMNVLTKENAMTLILPYIINRNGLTGTFAKKVVL